MTIGSISRFVLAHKLPVVLAWAVIFALSVVPIGPALVSLMGHWTW